MNHSSVCNCSVIPIFYDFEVIFVASWTSINETNVCVIHFDNINGTTWSKGDNYFFKQPIAIPVEYNIEFSVLILFRV